MHFRRALSLRPDFSDAQCNLAVALQGKGCKLESLQVLFEGLASRPNNVQLRRALAEALQGVTLGTAGEKERAILLSLCNDDNISMLYLATAVISLIKNADAYAILRKAAQEKDDPFASVNPAVEAFVRDPLLLAVLPRMTIVDADLERILTHMRRCLLIRAGMTPGAVAADPSILLDFMCSLARQGFYSQYAFFADEEEARRVEMVRDAAQSALRHSVTSPRTLEWLLVIVALYDSLQHVNGCERLLELPISGWSGAFIPIVQEQLVNRRREREIAAQITAITPIKDEVSRSVRGQYEESPYPLWVSVHHPRPVTIEELALALCPGQDFRIRPRPVPVLIAGCGTGRHPIEVARRYRECEILAVDLSLTSLAYAARMAERFGISSISFRQADILELGTLKRRFAIIECGGVLHHLKDPMEGWRVLVGLLEPDGLMKIGLYSERARSGIRAAREFIQPLDLPLTPEGIRACRRAIINLPDGHPAKDAMTFGDFFTLNGCRDLIMHVQEHNFTLPGIADCLDQLGLRFCSLQCETPMLDRFRAMFPEISARSDLDAWNRFEEAYPQAFKGMYQFWCCRK
jgi:SAM-dependent methyltransferase